MMVGFAICISATFHSNGIATLEPCADLSCMQTEATKPELKVLQFEWPTLLGFAGVHPAFWSSSKGNRGILFQTKRGLWFYASGTLGIGNTYQIILWMSCQTAMPFCLLRGWRRSQTDTKQ
jgi:hypothetical protein